MTNNTNKLKPVATRFLEQSSPLNSIYNKVRELMRLQAFIEAYLPSAMVSHVRISSYKNHELHVFIDNAHWATRLRYIEKDLIAQLRLLDAFKHINRIRSSVRPVYSAPSYHKAAKPISTKNAKQIESTAKYIEDGPLRKALLKLSKAKPPTT